MPGTIPSSGRHLATTHRVRPRLANALHRACPWLFALRKALLSATASDGYLRSSGFIQSWRRLEPCDALGQPLPWMCFGISEFLRERLRMDMRVFEYGSGSSTRFLSALVHDIHSVEDDPEWHRRVAASLPRNATVDLLTEAQPYVHAVAHGGPWHVVLIDGRRRLNCLEFAAGYVRDDGVLLLDDSQKPRYEPATEMMAKRGFKHLHFSGLKPMGGGYDRTTIFYRAQNCLGI